MKMKMKISLLTLVTTLFFSINAFAQVPEPTIGWDFVNDITDGDIDPVVLEGATITSEGLNVGPGKWARSSYTGTTTLKEITLVSIVKIGALSGGGSALTIGDNKANVFDGIVLGERTPGHWFAGSDFFKRTNLNAPANKVVEQVGQTVVIATSYKEVNGQAQVSIYRNGELLDTYTKGNLVSYGGNTEFLFGVRHLFQNSYKNTGVFTGTIMAAALFDEPLSAAQIKIISETALAEAGVEITYKIGDKHPDGGIVLSVSPDGKHGMMIMENDMGKLSHDEAQAQVKALGNGWELPAWQYLKEIYTNSYKTGIVSFNEDYYWTSWRPSKEFAKYVRFNDGYISDGPAGNKFYVRPVKKF